MCSIVRTLAMRVGTWSNCHTEPLAMLSAVACGNQVGGSRPAMPISQFMYSPSEALADCQNAASAE